MAVRETFEPNAGKRYFKGDVSLLLHAVARFKQSAVVTNLDLFHIFQHINNYLKSVGAYEAERQANSNLMRADDFPDCKTVEFYKFVKVNDIHYYQTGSFQFGSIQYYRTIEQQSSKDAMEGLANIALKTRTHLFGMSLASGYNFGIFCGTSNLNRRDEMSKRFGPCIIKIANVRKFADEVQALLGAKRVYLNSVSYNDLKMFRAKTLKSIGDPPVIDDNLFDLLYEISFLPSLFMKPTRFSIENELRLVFELPNDVPPPHVIRTADKALAKHIEIIQ